MNFEAIALTVARDHAEAAALAGRDVRAAWSAAYSACRVEHQRQEALFREYFCKDEAYQKMTFEDKLAALNMSKAAFARLVGIHVNTVSRWKPDAPKWAHVILDMKIALKGIMND